MVYTSDKAFTVLPPYATDAERALLDEARDFTERSFWHWSREETLQFSAEVAAPTEAFGVHWERALATRHRMVQAMSDGTYSAAGGSICYLISGRKAVGTPD